VIRENAKLEYEVAFKAIRKVRTVYLCVCMYIYVYMYVCMYV
jgi:hypothetical protein